MAHHIDHMAGVSISPMMRNPNAAVTRDNVDTAAARADLDAATERQKWLTPQTAEYAREQATIDFANARLTLAG
jgi:hypothetical protein